jgi:tRNA pseudouridine55 synthase
VISGILPIDKPAGWTSHDVVARVRRVAGQKAVGHAGTLDPLATGLLIVLLGDATRLSRYVMEGAKRYLACVVLGATTNTDDAEGTLTSCTSIDGLTLEAIRAEIALYVGEVDQIPPMYAAVRKNGVKLYTLARQGLEVEREPRRVRIDRVDVLRWEPPRLFLTVDCGSGTYIRSLARDIGAGLRVGGYLHALRRSRSADFSLADAVDLHALTDAGTVQAALVPSDLALLDWPAMAIDGDAVEAVRNGRAIPAPDARHATLRVYDGNGALLALCRVEDGVARPFRVMGGAQTRR